MPIRLQLLLFGVVGNILVAAIFIFSFGYRENIQEDSSNESLLTLYESAWYQTYNKSFDVMSKWLPVTGENASFWDPDSEILLMRLLRAISLPTLCWIRSARTGLEMLNIL